MPNPMKDAPLAISRGKLFRYQGDWDEENNCRKEKRRMRELPKMAVVGKFGMLSITQATMSKTSEKRLIFLVIAEYCMD